jgi:lipid-binding SYLF domain-containing protein/peptidoglycan hydrolase-like protein with peptidoglycan-binding domain
MSLNKLGIFIFSGFLIFAIALVSPAQSTAPDQGQTTNKQTTTTKSGASKDEIRNAQQALKDKGMYTGPMDGAMSADTQKALRDYQQKNNLKVTGTLNRETMSSLGVAPTGAATPEKKGSTQGKKTSSYSSKDEIRRTQEALKKDGFNPGPIDGVMGPMTVMALRSYQSHNGLKASGYIDQDTESSLLGASSSPVGGNASNTGDIHQKQQELADLGYLDPNQVNGMLSSQTRQAIRNFQWMNNLPVTGNLDEQTKTAIDSQGQLPVENAQLSQPPIASRQNTELRREKPAAVPQAVPQTEANAPNSKYNDSDARVSRDAAHRVSKAAEVLEDLTGAGDKRIPNELLEHAEAIAVIPGVIKGAFGIGGRYGKGVVSERDANGRWSPPAFIEIGGGSFGAQIGVSSTDLVLVFTDRKAMDTLERGLDLKLGVDAGVAAGPIGRSGEAGVNMKLASAVYAYSRSKGLFAGISLDGAVLNIEKHMNAKVYGSSVDARDILNGKVAANAAVQPFMLALDKVAPRKRIS